MKIREPSWQECEERMKEIGWQTKMEEEDATSWLMLGKIYSTTRSRLRNERKAQRCFQRAADMGHPVAMFEIGKKKNDLALIRQAADDGYDAAFSYLAAELAFGRTRDYRLAAYFYHKSSAPGAPCRNLSWLLENYEEECAPLGYWKPKKRLQRLVPARIRKMQFLWMLIAKRKGISRDVASIVTSFVCTPGA